MFGFRRIQSCMLPSFYGLLADSTRSLRVDPCLQVDSLPVDFLAQGSRLL